MTFSIRNRTAFASIRKFAFAASLCILALQGCGGGSADGSASTPTAVAPTITTQPASQRINQGTSATFTVAASGTAPLSYQWQRNGVDVVGATAASYVLPNVQTSDSGSVWHVAVRNAAGSINSADATLTVNSSGLSGLSVFAGKLGGGAGYLDGAIARFNNPRGVAVDSAGNVFVADTENNVIRKITPDGITSTFAGKRGVAGSTDGLGAVARFDHPNQIVVAASGNLYVSSGNRIRKISPTGSVTTLAASFTNSIPAIAVDKDENVYAVDTDKILVISPTGSSSSIGYGYSNGTGIAALTIDPSGTIIAAGYGTVTTNGQPDARMIVFKLGRDGQINVLASAAQGSFGLNGVVADTHGNIFVTGDNFVLSVRPDGTLQAIAGELVSGWTDGAGNAARFSALKGIAIDKSDNIYVADSHNNAIRKLTPLVSFAATSARLTTTIAGAPLAQGSAIDGASNIARFSGAHDIAADPAGNIFVADTVDHTIRKVTPSGSVSTFAGTTGSLGTADGLASAARFNYPLGIASDAVGNIYVVDSNVTEYPGPHPAGQPGSGENASIRKISSGAMVTTVVSTAWRSSEKFLNLYLPDVFVTSIAIDTTGQIFVGDAGLIAIRKVAPTGSINTFNITEQADGSEGTDLSSLVVDSKGNIYYTMPCHISKLAPDGVTITIVAGTTYCGASDGTSAAASFNHPHGLAFDKAGNLFVADTNNHTIRKITPDGIVSTVAGVAGFIGTVPGNLPATLSYPTGMAINASGALFTMSENALIKIVLP